MAKITSLAQLGELADSLAKLRPGSLKVLGIVRNTAAEILDLNIWVDKWPEYTTVIASPSKATKIPEYIQNVYSVYTKPGMGYEGCASLLRKCGVIGWCSPIVFGGISDELKPVIEKAAAEKECKAEIMDACHVMSATQETLVTDQSELPEGLTDGTLTSENAALVTSRWKHGDVTAEGYVRFLITNFPSVCIRDESGAPIGWFTTSHYNSMGLLHVEPEYRGRGLAKRLVTRLARDALTSGNTACVIIEDENVISRQLHMRCGFSQLEGEDVSWVVVKPVSSCYSTKKTCCV